MSHSVAAVAFFTCLVALASAQAPTPYVHVSTFAAQTCSGQVQVFDTYPVGSCIQTGPAQSLSVNCGSGATGMVYSNTSDCSVSGDNASPVDLATCSSVYLGINSTSACDTFALTDILGQNFVVRYYWGSDMANCLNDPSLTLGSPEVFSPVGLQGASQMALDRCSDYNGLQWNAYSVFPTILANNTLKVFLYSAPGCNAADAIGFLNPDHGVCNTITGDTATFYETWFSSTVLGSQPPGMVMSPMSMPPMDMPPPMAAPVAAPVAAAPVAAPVAVAPVAAPVSAPVIAPPVKASAPRFSAASLPQAGFVLIIGCILSLLL